jgi:uncharacterized protein (DUF2141 family)
VRRSLWPLALLTLSLAPPSRAGESVTIELRIGNIRSTDGQVLVVLFAQEDGFPGEPDKAFAKDIVPAKPGATRATFVVPPGRYAALAVHDVNGNGDCDMRWPIPIPKEPVGASRDAKGFMGPPKFRDAAFDAAAGTVVQAFDVADL